MPNRAASQYSFYAFAIFDPFCTLRVAQHLDKKKASADKAPSIYIAILRYLKAKGAQRSRPSRGRVKGDRKRFVLINQMLFLHPGFFIAATIPLLSLF
jgi:hypothetical protein